MPNRPQSGTLLNKSVHGTSTRCSDKEKVNLVSELNGVDDGA